MLFLPVVVLAQTTEENFIKTTIYKIPTQNSISTPFAEQATINIQYFDGLGRPKQNIIKQAGGQKQDIITPIVYDAFGRQVKDYLPLPTSSNNGEFVTNAEFKTKQYYKANYVDDFPGPIDGIGINNTNPYSETFFEASPLNRNMKIGAPGNSWKGNPNNNNDKTIKFEYKTNATNEVKRFTATTHPTTFEPTFLSQGTYAPNQLYVTITKDENWTQGNLHTTREYEDKLGRVVLKRTYGVSQARTIDPNTVTPHDTYYVYDEYGNLTYVLPPLLDKSNVTQEVLDDLGYQYQYDHRNRLVEKKMPGKDWEYIVYDKLDRPVLSQDKNLKDQGKWLFTKYDVFSRVAYTGIFNSPNSRLALQSTLDSQNTIFEIRETSPITINGTNLYYSNQSFPINNIDVFSVNYYDTYVDYVGLSLPSSVFGVNRTQNTQGLSTVSKVRTIGTSDWITTLSTYDEKGRMIYTDSKNEYLDSRDITRLKLDFTGKVEETHASHIKAGNSTINIRDYYHYDHNNRLKTHKQKIDNEPIQLINENFYDELGQLHRTDVGGETMLDGYTDIQHIDVSYDGTITNTYPNGGIEPWPSLLKTKGKIPKTYDGGIKFKPLQNDKFIVAGLVKPQNSNNPDNLYMDYGILLHYTVSSGVKVKLWVNGEAYPSPGYSYGTYNSGDTFKIVREGTQIKFYHNSTSPFEIINIPDNDDELIGKLTFTGPEGAQVVDLNLFGPNINKKLQNVNYNYNVRGWLTDINKFEAVGLENNTDLFHFKINYNNPIVGSAGNPGLAEPLFNGNISQTIWRTANQDTQKRSYGYKYDGLNRLKAAYSRKGSDLNTEDFHSVNDVIYDWNGNITSFSRDGFIEGVNSPMPWDDLTYAYEGNQLVSVTDNSNNEAGFSGKPDPNSPLRTAAYTYDANGNLKSDTGKNIVDISYNHLNLPVTITILDENQQGGYISYVYDATGVKLSKTFTPTGINPNSIETQYAGNFIYEKSITGELTLQFFGQPEGYVIPVAGSDRSVKGFDIGTGTTTYSSYSYVFQYKDHLGNVRLSYSDMDLNGSIDPNTEIIEENNYYPFGLKQKGYNTVVTSAGNTIAQQYKFGGKQLQDELGLQWYDFGARNYDAAIGRWFNVDPLAELAPDWTPYRNGFNNPLRFTDPTGMYEEDWVRKNDGDTWVWREDITTEAQAVAVGLQYGGATKDDVIKNWGFNTTDGFEGMWNRFIGSGHGQKFDWDSYLSGRIPVAIEQGIQSQINKNQELRDNPWGDDVTLTFSNIDLGIEQLPNSYGNEIFQSSFNFNGEKVLFTGTISTFLNKDNRYFNFMQSYEIFNSSAGDYFKNAIFFHRGLSESVNRIPTLILEVHSDKHFKTLHDILRF